MLRLVGGIIGSGVSIRLRLRVKFKEDLSPALTGDLVFMVSAEY